MDRFIVLFDDVYVRYELYLKSNMDRFIDFLVCNPENLYPYLKSNMDRFIEILAVVLSNYRNSLKSNMDRFIGYSHNR